MSGLGRVSRFAGNTFAIWVILFAVLAFIFPNGFAWIADYISWLLGIIMFGMGLTLTLDDFKSIGKQPKSVLIGVVAQYTIMPLLAFGLATVFQLPAEVAVGVILVGCCPGGTSSNVMSYLANANVALSVAITSVSTLLAPLLTPALIYLFAHEWLQVSFISMFWSVVQVILIPIIIGFVLQKLFKTFADKTATALPIVSVVAISLILASVVGSSKAQILATGLLIFAVVILHNLIGYILGYTFAKILKLDRPDKKAVSIEVGMQNSGLAVSLATVHFNPLSAVPGAVFSLIHNITGPILAKYWNKR